MSVTASQIFELAEELHSLGRESESYRRAVINRAYYAAFLNARDFLRMDSRKADGHAAVIEVLKTNYLTQGNQLGMLKVLRQTADYVIDKEIPQRDADKALDLSRKITAGLQSDSSL
jgi:uncharacterized protein (UPF0332 family)